MLNGSPEMGGSVIRVRVPLSTQKKKTPNTNKYYTIN